MFFFAILHKITLITAHQVEQLRRGDGKQAENASFSL
jgi:hypothetical protein